MRIKTVAFLARWPGFLVLKSLMSNPRIDLQAVYTHGVLPKEEGGGVRPELYHYEKQVGDIPFFVINSKYDFSIRPADLIIALSWRFKLNDEILGPVEKAINIHRGDLPKYAGAEPVRRAIEAKENFVAITAHHMIDEIDAGDKIAQVWFPIPQARHGLSTSEHAEQVKEHLYPLYDPLVNLSISTIFPSNWSSKL